MATEKDLVLEQELVTVMEMVKEEHRLMVEKCQVLQRLFLSE